MVGTEDHLVGTEDHLKDENLRWRGSLIVSVGLNLVLVLMLIMQVSMTTKFRNLTNSLTDTGNAAVQAAAAWEKASVKADDDLRLCIDRLDKNR
jgi:hypothetical protein